MSSSQLSVISCQLDLDDCFLAIWQAASAFDSKGGTVADFKKLTVWEQGHTNESMVACTRLY